MSHAPRPRKFLDTLHDPAWLRERYVDEAMSSPRIAALVGCAVPTVKWALRKHGIPMRSVREARRLRTPARADKAAVIDAYGGRCSCCGERELAFLSLDHVNGGGRAHRRAIGGNQRLYRELRDAGWPANGYRILCMNCQFGFMHGRTCPHQRVA